jgi:hypothetical protein
MEKMENLDKSSLITKKATCSGRWLGININN